MSTKQITQWIVTAGIILSTNAAFAKDKADAPQPKIFKDLSACRAIVGDAERLACFDRTSALMTSAAENKDIVVLDRAEVTKTKRSLFGFNLPKLPFFSGKEGDDQPEFTEITTKITQVRSLGYGKWVITIAEGAKWQSTEAMNLEPSAGEDVTIKAGTLGGYFMKAGRGRSVRAMRVN